jgi:membrane protein
VGPASLLALLGVAPASDYLFPSSQDRSAESQPIARSARQVADGRGRQATTPSKIPVPGWKDILLRAYSNISKHRILALGHDLLQHTGHFSCAIAALVAVYGLFSDPSTIARHLDQLSGFLPDGAIEVAREQLTRLASKGSQALGLTFLVGLGVSL